VKNSRAERRRAGKSVMHRSGKTVHLDKCPVDKCPHFIDPKSDLGLCTECDRIGRVVNYGTTQILLQLGIIRKKGDPPKAPQSPVLLVPKPGQEKAAIEEAKRISQEGA